MDDIVYLNVGGVTDGFYVARYTLCSVKGSNFEIMFSRKHQIHKINYKIFINRNPKVFSLLWII